MGKIFLILFLVIKVNIFEAQIAYPDSCLQIEFFYSDKEDKLETKKSIKIKRNENIANSIFYSDFLLNLIVLFRNTCNRNITIPDKVLFGDFWLEGIQVNNDKEDSLKQLFSVDYLPGMGGAGDYILVSGHQKQLSYSFPLGFNINSKGVYKFRLCFRNSHNYIPFDEWKTYHSNWIYLKLL